MKKISAILFFITLVFCYKNVYAIEANICEYSHEFQEWLRLSDEEKNEAEKLVNEWIAAAIDVVVEEMPKDEAIKSGAECMFIEKYPDVVTVYTIGDVSKELCGGPHVKNTSELGKFVIKKEEASSAGVRRIKAVLE